MLHRSLILGGLGAALGVFGGVATVAWYASNRVNPRPLRGYFEGYTFTPWELGIPFETVTLTSDDGL